MEARPSYEKQKDAYILYDNAAPVIPKLVG